MDLGIGRAIEQAQQVENFLRLQTGAFDAQLLYRLCQIGDAAEIEANGSATRTGLRSARPTQIVDRLGRLGQFLSQDARDPCAARSRQLRFAQRARHIAAQQARSDSNSRISALVFSSIPLILPPFAKSFFDHRHRALCDR